MAKHTAWPWRACGQDRGGCKCRLVWAIGDDVPVAIALMADDPQCDGEGLASMEIAKANARLIAAAPELLETLQAVRDATEVPGPVLPRGSKALLPVDVMIRVDRALVKAK